MAQLEDYIRYRDEARMDFSEPYLLITTGGQRVLLRSFEYALQRIRGSLLEEHGTWNRRPPRLYDLRHTFACRTLLNWLKDGINVDTKVIFLSTYLGHVKIADTYWYLTGIPELMEVVSGNFEKTFSMEGRIRDED